MLITLVVLAITGVLFWKVFFPMIKDAKGMMQSANQMIQGINAQNNLAMTGTPAQGRVIQMQDTGTRINMNPLIRFTVEVQTATPYQAMFDAMVPMISLSRVQPGNVVPVRIDPTNPGRVALGAL